MKKKIRALSLIILVLLNGSCGKSSRNASADSDSTQCIDSTDVQSSLLWGHIGEGTSMNVIEFITMSGDTLYLPKTESETGYYAEMLGDIRNQTDQFAILANVADNADPVLISCVNATEMMGVWKHQNEHIAFYADGSAENSTSTMKSWTLQGTQLIVAMTSTTEYGETTYNDTLRLKELSEGSLTYVNRHGEVITLER